MPKEAQSLLPSDIPDRAIILERLHRVLDPELDEPVLQLGLSSPSTCKRVMRRWPSTCPPVGVRSALST